MAGPGRVTGYSRDEVTGTATVIPRFIPISSDLCVWSLFRSGRPTPHLLTARFKSNSSTMGYSAQKFVDAGTAAIMNQALSAGQAADEIAKQCNQSIDSAASESASKRHTGASATYDDDSHSIDVENFFWPFWSDVLDLAQGDASMHDRVARVIAVLKAKGTEGCDSWSVWGSETDWSQLPLLGPVSREAMNGAFFTR